MRLTRRALVPAIAVAVVGAFAAPATAAIERVSIDSAENEQNNEVASGLTSVSADGRHVAFDSFASNLVAGDTNGVADVFVRDRQGGTTERISVSSSGAQSNETSSNATVSANGRYVAFRSEATNLVAGDTNGWSDVFVRDRQAGTTERVSLTAGGGQIAGASAGDSLSVRSISADGRYVVFHSTGPGVTADCPSGDHVFVRDRVAGVTECVSVGAAGAGNGASFHATISDDGDRVAFLSDADNLVAGDTNQRVDVFVRDRSAATTTRVNVSSGSAQANDDTRDPQIAPDGSAVAFASLASNLVAGDTNGNEDVFVHDLAAGTTERVSVRSDRGQNPQGSSNPSIGGPNGRYVSFDTMETLTPGDENWTSDIYTRDRTAGTTTLETIGGDFFSAFATLSADGDFLSFISEADNLVPDDTNRVRDAFVRAPDPAADLAIELRATGSLLRGTATYDLTVTNNGPAPLAQATVAVQLPREATAVSSPSACTYDGATDLVRCAIGPLARGASATPTFTTTYALLSTGLQLQATAVRATSRPNDPNPANDRASANCTVLLGLVVAC